LDRRNSGLTQAGELFLFSASRAQLVQDVIRPALKRNTIVICDRYVDSTTAYQGYGRQIPLDVIASVNRLATGGLLPDRTFFLEIPLEEIERRTHARGVSRDRMESIGREFFSRVQDGFRALARTEDRILVLDGMNPVEVLHQHVLADVLRARSVERIQSKQSGE
jgi:dTMP kinase